MARRKLNQIDVTKVVSHRNGISGAGFYLVLFLYNAGDQKGERHMIATVFEAPHHIAVLDRDDVATGALEFGEGHSWRGDNFEPALRQAIADYELDEAKGRGTYTF